MFVHQIIDDLRYLEKNAVHQSKKTQCRNVVSVIQRSIPFYLGRMEIGGWGETVFKETWPFNNIDNFKLPYESILLEFDTSTDNRFHTEKSGQGLGVGVNRVDKINKVAVFIHKNDNGLFAASLVNARFSDAMRPGTGFLPDLWTPPLYSLVISNDLPRFLNTGLIIGESKGYREINPTKGNIPVFLNILEPLDGLEAYGGRKNWPEDVWHQVWRDSIEIYRWILNFSDLLQCKNVGIKRVDPPLKLNKKRSKKGKTPLTSYHELVLQPTKTRGGKVPPQQLWKTRVHLRRGHFKTYTEDNPLFGKVTGRFWWQPSVAGTKEKGVINKSYNAEKLINNSNQGEETP